MAEEQKPKLTQVTPEEFEKLLRGESVPVKSLNGQNKCFLKTVQSRKTIEVRNVKVLGQVSITENHPFPIKIFGNSNLGELRVSTPFRVKELSFFDNVTVHRLTVINQSRVETIIFHGNSQITDINITGSTCRVESLVITTNRNVYGLNISGEAIIDFISIGFNTHMNDINVQMKAQVEKIVISSNTKIKNFCLTGQARVGDLKVEGNSEITEIGLFGGVISRQIECINLSTKSLRFNGTPLDIGRIVLSSVKLESLCFVDCNIKASVKIFNVVSKKGGDNSPFIEFTRSSFHQLELIGNEFSSFDFLVFENSNLTNAFIADTDFPDKIYTRLNSKNSKLLKNHDKLYKNANQAKLFFEQIKTAFLNQGNNTEALDYKAKELRAHHQSLKKNYWRWDGFRKRTFDLFTLFANKWTNGFGVNWVLGIVVFIGVTSLLYGCILTSTKSVEWVWPWQTEWSDYKIYISHYFDFINPTSTAWKKWEYLYQLEGLKLETGNLRGGIKGQLFISKVIIITLAYQIIQAFRKFGRR